MHTHIDVYHIVIFFEGGEGREEVDDLLIALWVKSDCLSLTLVLKYLKIILQHGIKMNAYQQHYQSIQFASKNLHWCKRVEYIMKFRHSLTTMSKILLKFDNKNLGYITKI